jgi:vacuolar-type H+-ATPase subunit E/Vma4
MIVQRASTRKPNRSCAEIEAAIETAANKRAEKACQMAHNAKAKRQKTSQKAARAALKTAEPPSEPRFLWTDNESLEALQFIKALKEEFDRLSKARPGYIKWGPFVIKYTGKIKDEHLLVKELSNEVIFHRYNALIAQYKVCPSFNL